MTNGNKPNQPNTLNSYTDGGGGTCHGSDESIDKIVVSQASGITSKMTKGDTVKITKVLRLFGFRLEIVNSVQVEERKL